MTNEQESSDDTINMLQNKVSELESQLREGMGDSGKVESSQNNQQLVCTTGSYNGRSLNDNSLQYPNASSSTVTHSSPRNGMEQGHTSNSGRPHTAETVVAATKEKACKYNCSNCGEKGHMVDECLKPGKHKKAQRKGVTATPQRRNCSPQELSPIDESRGGTPERESNYASWETHGYPAVQRR